MELIIKGERSGKKIREAFGSLKERSTVNKIKEELARRRRGVDKDWKVQ